MQEKLLNQAGILVKTVHAVEVLNCHPACATEEVIFAYEDYDRIANYPQRNIQKISARTMFGTREMRNDSDKWFFCIIIAIQVQQPTFGKGPVWPAIDGGEDTPVHWD